MTLANQTEQPRFLAGIYSRGRLLVPIRVDVHLLRTSLAWNARVVWGVSLPVAAPVWWARAMNSCECRGAGCPRCAAHHHPGTGWAAARSAPQQAFETVKFSTAELLKPGGSRVVFPKDFDAHAAARSGGDPDSFMAPPVYATMDERTRNTWEYPSSEDYPDREYQLEIASVALFQNTLVALPTGLGKTFIAAVVMYNFYRWGSRAEPGWATGPRDPPLLPLLSCLQLVSLGSGRLSRPDAPSRDAAD